MQRPDAPKLVPVIGCKTMSCGTTDWPGNVRELQNAIRRGCCVSDGEIRSRDPPARLSGHWRIIIPPRASQVQEVVSAVKQRARLMMRGIRPLRIRTTANRPAIWKTWNFARSKARCAGTRRSVSGCSADTWHWPHAVPEDQTIISWWSDSTDLALYKSVDPLASAAHEKSEKERRGHVMYGMVNKAVFDMVHAYFGKDAWTAINQSGGASRMTPF